MRPTSKRSALATLILSTALAVPLVALGADDAQADVTVRVRGKVDVKVDTRKVKRIKVRHRRHHRQRTHRPRVRLRIGGGIHWHGEARIGRFSQPPPPPPPPPVHDCSHDTVPTYYTSPPPPVYRPRVRPVVHVARSSKPALPRLGLGVFAGSINVDDRMSGEDLGIFGRLRLTDSLLFEAEIASTRMDDLRMDRRVGGALLYDLAPRSKWSAHLLAGAGMTRVDVQDGMWQSKQEYGELGAGLSLRISKRLQLSADLRAGARSSVDDEPTDPVLKNLAPSSENEEKYTRGRLSAILYF